MAYSNAFLGKICVKSNSRIRTTNRANVLARYAPWCS